MREHKLDSLDCWCLPQIRVICKCNNNPYCKVCLGAGFIITTLSGLDRYVMKDIIMLHNDEQTIS